MVANIANPEELHEAHKKRMKKIRKNRRSIENVLTAVHRNNNRYDVLWNIAPRAPMFCKKPRIVKVYDKKKEKTQERKVMNTVRIFSSHKHATLASNAFAAKTFSIADMGERLRTLPPGDLEEKSAPALLRMSQGFKMLLDQAIVAYVQNVVARQSHQEWQKRHKKLMFSAVDIAARSIDRDLFCNSGLATHLGDVPKVPSKKSSKKKRANHEAQKNHSAVVTAE